MGQTSFQPKDQRRSPRGGVLADIGVTAACPLTSAPQPVDPTAAGQLGRVQLLFDTREASAILNVSYDWLKRRASRGTVPHTRMGRYVRFTMAQLQEIVAVNERPVLAKQARSSARSRL